MRRLYTIIYALLLPFAFMRLYWRGRRNPPYRRHWLERLGYSELRLKECIWVHAVSLGETIAAEPLIRRLLVDYPHENIVLTSLTPTGRARAATIKHERIFYCHLPYDLPGLLRRFYRRVHPKLLIIMETELWPNLLAVTRQANIPVILANARLSEKSARGYGRVAAMTRQMLHNVNTVAVQNGVDGERFVRIGLPKERLTVTGSIKFDLSLPADLDARAAQLRQMWTNRPVWIAASTHPNEEEQILAAHRLVLAQLPAALLILVPRHPERFAGVKQLCELQGFEVVTRSSGRAVSPETPIYLGDSMGELMLYYAAAQVAFVGGSLVATGGHNPLEPAALGVPVICGPHVFNFAEITRLLIAAGAEIQINNSAALAQRLIELLQDPALRQAIGGKAVQVVAANRGALDKLCQVVAHYLPLSRYVEPLR